MYQNTLIKIVSAPLLIGLFIIGAWVSFDIGERSISGADSITADAYFAGYYSGWNGAYDVCAYFAVMTPATLATSCAGNQLCLQYAAACGVPAPDPSSPSCQLSANPNPVQQGNPATLSWTTANAVSILIDHAIGAVTPVPSGSVSVTPSVTTTYTATVTSAGMPAPATETYNLGGTSCNGGWCYWTPTTAAKVCSVHGYDAAASVVRGGSGGNVCSWTGSSWSCDNSCTSSCNGRTLTQVTCTDTAPPTQTLSISGAYCNGGRCFSDVNTSAKVCSMNGYNTAIASVEGGPGGNVCSWTGSSWSCDNSCTHCNGRTLTSVTCGNSAPSNAPGTPGATAQCSTTVAVTPTPQCSDGVDSDYDGATDYPADFSCSSPTDDDETNPKAQCQDGIDNDGDGKIDYPQDPGCFGKQDNDEFNAPIAGCIQVLKETFNPSGVKITPVAQFAFKLDGATTTQNDANGNAQFNDVPIGTHTVTEVSAGSAWNLFSVTPASGQVVVSSGPSCSAVVFKNKQVVPAPSVPACTLHASPYNLSTPGNTTLSWTTANANSVSINQGVGVVTPIASGSKNVFVSATKTFIATVTGPGGTATCTKKVTVAPQPPKICTLEITKSVNKTEVVANGQVEYTINFKNTGTADCTGGGVKIVDVVDTGLMYVSESHSSNVNGGYGSDPVYRSSDRTLRWNGNVLNPGETGWMKFKAKGKTPDECSVTIPNKAKITSAEYDNFTTWVESNTVNVTVSKDCEIDVCPNIEGTQTSIPDGYHKVEGQCVIVPPPETPVPACTLSVNPGTIHTGQSAIVSWTSANVNAGSLNGNIGAIPSNKVASGSFEVFPPDDFIYVGTFTGPHGSVQCETRIEVTIGGGGCTVNCGGGGHEQPNVPLFGKPGEQPLAFVSLSQIPYTGFEAGPLLSLAFWLAVALWSAGIAYVVMGKGSMRFVAGRLFAFAPAWGGRAYDEAGTRAEETESAAVSLSTMAPALPAISIMPLPPSAVSAQEGLPAQAGIPLLSDVIESRAHAAGILLSPEALSMALSLGSDRAETLHIFVDVLNEAVRTLPRDDGWILMSSDRFGALTEKRAPASQATILPAEHAVSGEAPRLADAIVRGDRDAAFAAVHTAEVGNHDAVALLQEVASALAVRAAAEDDARLEGAAQIFSRAIMAPYASKYTSLKLALAQAFEVKKPVTILDGS